MKCVIVGFWHSGTTILAKLLSQHPDIKLLSNGKNLELDKKHPIVTSPHIIGYNPLVPSLNHVAQHGVEQLEPRRNMRAFEEQLRKGFGNGNVLVKIPHFITSKHLLDAAIPECKRILVIRNGRSFSISKLRHISPIVKAKAWKSYMEMSIDSWLQDKNTLVVRYENLCNNTEEELGRIFDYIGVDPIRPKIAVDSRNYKWDKFANLDVKQQVEKIIGPTEEVLSQLVPYAKPSGRTA